jgi:type II secretory pathway pseudopilin PulG
MLVLAVMAILAGMAIPQTTATIERSRTLGAARYLATRLALARTQAVAHSANVALVFVADGDTYTVATYSDGNRNGVRTRDIAAGVDPVVEAPVRFSDLFPRVLLFLSDPAAAEAPDASALMSFSPIGTASSRTLYVRGRDQSQYAVRVLGATGRTRLLRYVDATKQWVEVL